ncbi:MAG: hypothetical protein P8018_10775 [Acidobacteriota bacterium]|jgi:hypothetical protein
MNSETAPNQAVQTPAAASSGKKKGCCLLGCLGMLVAACLVGGVAWLAYARLGKPWIRAERTRLVKKYPLLGSVLEANPKGLSIQERAGGSTSKGSFPSDIYLPQDSLRSSFRSHGDDDAAVVIMASSDEAALRRRYRAEMARSGWRLIRTTTLDPGSRQTYAKGGFLVQVSFLPGDNPPGSTEIWIHRFKRVKELK